MSDLVALLIWIGCAFWAGKIGRRKGYPALGYVLGGLLSFVGVLIIAIVPRAKQVKVQQAEQIDPGVAELRVQVEQARLRNQIADLDREFYKRQGDAEK
jgi:hypothetical protein